MYNSKKTTVILSVVAVLLAIIAAMVWLLPYASNGKGNGYSHGDGDSLQVGHRANGRAGNVDGNDKANVSPSASSTEIKTERYENAESQLQSQASNVSTHIKSTDLRSMARSNPFYSEAAKILQGKLDENDAKRRKVILNYCEHFRMAYTTKDIDFLRQVFSDKALIIVGNVVKNAPANADGVGDVGADSRVTYALHTKAEYLSRLEKVFKTNKSIDVRFSDFKILRHPTMDGIYGVTLRQHYKSDRYEDDGWLFLLWDFTNPSMPLIHVRTWQPAKTVSGKDDVINISDFNLE